jgi:hypothetical protein
MQNGSVFDSSIAQLKPPQNKIPNMKPKMTSAPSEKRALGRAMKVHRRDMKPLCLL